MLFLRSGNCPCTNCTSAGSFLSLYKITIRYMYKLYFSWFFCDLSTKCSSFGQVHVQTVLLLVLSFCKEFFLWLGTCTNCTSTGFPVISVQSIHPAVRDMNKIVHCTNCTSSEFPVICVRKVLSLLLFRSLDSALIWPDLCCQI